MKKLLLLFFAVFMLFITNNAFAAFNSKKSKGTDSVNSLSAGETVQKAIKEFNSLSKHERKSKFKEIKKAIREYKAQKKEGTEVDTNTLLLVIIAILIPPLAVYLFEGEISTKFWIAVLLSILGLILFGAAGILFLGTLPGILYALYIILGGG